MKALETTNLMHHGTGFIKDTIAALMGWAYVGPQLKVLFAFIDPIWLGPVGAIAAVLVGRAVDILYKEIKARRRQRRFPDENDSI